MNLESKISKVSRKFRRSIILGAIAFICPLRVITVNSPLFFRVGEDLLARTEGREFAQVSRTVPFAIRACEMQALLSNSAAVEFIIDLSARAEGRNIFRLK